MIDLNTEEMLNVRRFAGDLVELLLQQEGIWTLEIRPEGLAVHWTMVTPMEDLPAATSIRSCRYMMPFCEIQLGRSVKATAAAILQMIEQAEEPPECCSECGTSLEYTDPVCAADGLCSCCWNPAEDIDWDENDSWGFEEGR